MNERSEHRELCLQEIGRHFKKISIRRFHWWSEEILVADHILRIKAQPTKELKMGLGYKERQGIRTKVAGIYEWIGEKLR